MDLGIVLVYYHSMHCAQHVRKFDAQIHEFDTEPDRNH